MIVKSIELKDFRNYESLKMELSPGINILYGDNAQGKTNVLEALYMCGTTKSHKNSKDKEIIMISKEEAHIRVMLEKDEIGHKVDMHLKKSKSKGIAIDGIPIKKSSELLGMMPVIFFSPEDLSIIKDGPAERRRFLDMELCQTDKIYYYNLSNYNKVLTQRGNLLKQIEFDRTLKDTIDLWDEQLVEYGKQIITIRNEFIQQINEMICEIHHRITEGKEQIRLAYDPNISAERMQEELFLHRDIDLVMKTTGIGPHRDDVIFYINDIDVRKYGSQGQQRTAALSLKLAEIELMKKKFGFAPLLLLDDVFSELDRSRQNHLLESLKKIQTVITCTGMEEYVKERMIIDKVYKIVNGTAMEEKGNQENE